MTKTPFATNHFKASRGDRLFLSLKHSNFEFVSDFEIRISDLTYAVCLKRLWLIAVLMLLTGLGSIANVHAHEIRPALLNITEQKPGWFEVTWKVPMRGNRILAVKPVLPSGMAPYGPSSDHTVPGASIQYAAYQMEGGSLAGETIAIDGLTALQIDVMVQIKLADGTAHSAILRPDSPEFMVPFKASKFEVAGSYWRMGIIHILEGIDHLLFVLALMLIVSKLVPLLKAVTAFTVAHSITLALATLGVVHVPSKPTEAIISLSIVFLAAEIIHKYNGKTGLTERYPWVIAFVFGLFHGLGFAGALSEIGVPQHEVPLALFMFNVGVESGQLIFIGAVLGLMAVSNRLPLKVPQSVWRVLPYSIGSLAAFWTIERVLSFMPPL